eukprot:09700.XXX_147474_125173_1 [CDS] Oithona nana genome sequencing.
MWDQYQPWVLSTYGDAAKTKTITTKKYARIVALLRTLNGTTLTPIEAAKFKLWVKSKGFHLGPPPGHPDRGLPHTLVVAETHKRRKKKSLPSSLEETARRDEGSLVVKDEAMDGKVHFVYKKVAMVEQFFDIIYSVHVEAAGDTQIRGRAGKHCGQKRTYRAVADQYAFIPREAISKFLLYCIDCQRKNSLDNGDDEGSDTATAESGHSPPMTPESAGNPSNGGSKLLNPSAAAAFSQAVAAMQSLRSMQQARTSLLVNAAAQAQHHPHSQLLASQFLQNSAPALLNNSMGHAGGACHPKIGQGQNGQDIDLTLPITSTYLRRMRAIGLAAGLDQSFKILDRRVCRRLLRSSRRAAQRESRTLNRTIQKDSQELIQNAQRTPTNEQSEFNPGLSDQTVDTSCQDDASSNGAKDDEDDEEDDDDKMEGLTCGDPEKLKAFNMFVRLFVDENLDRHVPISKQPKEKIQAIIDSCTRQFPEFAPRARKRIRTYLKSCRRTKRTREQAGLDGVNARPAPPHLTSIQAEQLLAKACENESENAKRMRMGLEPISQPMPAVSTHSIVDVLSHSSVGGNSPATPVSMSALFPNMSAVTSEPSVPPKMPKNEYKPEQLATLLQAAASQQGSTTLTPVMRSYPYHLIGPTTDVLRKQPLLNHKLNATEITAVRQLVTGYRESAAFLLRSADELEHLLQIQPKL